MTLNDHLAVDLSWLSETEEDPDWWGFGPRLTNLEKWIRGLHKLGHEELVRACVAAVAEVLPVWTEWLEQEPAKARESCMEGEPPGVQFDAVREWLASPTMTAKKAAWATTDSSRQLYWYHSEYEDFWFEFPRMWVVEAADSCVSTLVKRGAFDPAERVLLCSMNVFRAAVDHPWDEPLERIISAIRKELA